MNISSGFGFFSNTFHFFSLLLRFARQFLSSQNEQLCFKESLKLKANCILTIFYSIGF